jgi:hypothetical protein
MGVGLVIFNLAALELLQFLKIAIFFGECFFLCNLGQIAYVYAIIIIDTLHNNLVDNILSS